MKKSKYNYKRYAPLYIMLLPAVLLVFFFSYVPLPGIIMAFMDYDFVQGFSSPFVGLENFKTLFTMPAFGKSIINTLYISCLNLVIGFPAPIIFALLLNEMRIKWFKKTVQTVSYMPYFLSWISVIGIATAIYSNYGIINDIRIALFGEETERIMLLGEQWFFVPNIVILSIWKGIGWNSIIYLASITSIDPGLYEAAHIDGAGKFRQCIHITIPGIMPTVVVLLILQAGSMLSDNFDLVYGLQNPFIDFEVISTMIYKAGITQGDYSMAATLGLFQGVIGFMLIFLANTISKKVNNYSIW